MLKFSFYSNRTQFDGDALEKRGLGGSESALINLTRAIKEVIPDSEITVYNGNRKPKEYNGIIYKSSMSFSPKTLQKFSKKEISKLILDTYEKLTKSKKISKEGVVNYSSRPLKKVTEVHTKKIIELTTKYGFDDWTCA